MLGILPDLLRGKMAVRLGAGLDGDNGFWKCIFKIFLVQNIKRILHYCQLNGIQDTSRGNTYHNKRFKEEAEKRGLLIDYDPKIGHSITQPAPALKSFCTAQRWRNKLTIARTLDLPGADCHIHRKQWLS